jgi:hypothetical protein
MTDIIGTLRGIALVYDVKDQQGTSFIRGALESSHPRVKMGLVDLWWKHGQELRGAERDSALRIGRVTELRDVRLPDSRWGAEIEAAIFDTEKGCLFFDVIEVALRDERRVGLSVSFPMSRASGRWDYGRGHYVYEDTPLSEVSITHNPSVPGAHVRSVTRRPAEGWATMAERSAALRQLDYRGQRPPRSDFWGAVIHRTTGRVTSVRDWPGRGAA